jgi:ribosomal protein S18 acetylase RimI-like enzyme
MRLEAGDAPAPGVRLREIAPGDEALLRALYRSARDPELRMTPWTEAQKQAFADSQFDLQDRWYRGNYAGAQFLVIERAAEPVGRLYVHDSGREVTVMDITSAPAARNQGLGTLLMRWLLGKAQAEGLDVTLHVETNNPARVLYQRLGFREEGEEGVYLRLRWTPGCHRYKRLKTASSTRPLPSRGTTNITKSPRRRVVHPVRRLFEDAFTLDVEPEAEARLALGFRAAAFQRIHLARRAVTSPKTSFSKLKASPRQPSIAERVSELTGAFAAVAGEAAAAPATAAAGARPANCRKVRRLALM